MNAPAMLFDVALHVFYAFVGTMAIIALWLSVNSAFDAVFDRRGKH